jgi:NAD(P)H dehydrogenase (quinone)
MNFLILYAHPTRSSFNGKLLDVAIEALTDAGHTVEVSDLYNINFNPVAGKRDVTHEVDNGFFKLQIEQNKAIEQGTLSADIIEEQNKLLWSDFVILQFPLWWFSLPAILKGYIDRVMTVGFAYGGGKWYDTGGLSGRKAMLSLTTGGPEQSYTERGINGDIDSILFHINHGMLAFCGFKVVEPFIAWSAAHVGDEGRQEYIDAYRNKLQNIVSEPLIQYPSLADYDPKTMTLKD